MSRAARTENTGAAIGQRAASPEYRTHPDSHIASIDVDHILYLGPEGSFSDMMAKMLFEDALKHEPQASFGDITRSLRADPKAVAVIPIRNEITGDVHDVVTDLRKNGGEFAVRAEATLIINLVLASRGHRTANISTIYSHPQPLKQASNFIGSLNGVTTHPVESTARAAEIVKASRGTEAAICSPQAVRLNKLVTLQENIEDKPEVRPGQPQRPNSTRFLIIQSLDGFTPNIDDLLSFHGARSKVAGIFSPRREEDDGLIEMLMYLREQGIKTSTKIPSVNPTKEGGLDYFLEARGDPFRLRELLTPGNVFTDALFEFKLLGAYPVSSELYKAPDNLYD